MSVGKIAGEQMSVVQMLADECPHSVKQDIEDVTFLTFEETLIYPIGN